MAETKCNQAKCPKGKFFNGCNDTAANCEDCPYNTFIETENQMKKCLPCRECLSQSHFITDHDCKADTNRQCKCKPGYHCNNKVNCDQCIPVTSCPPGKGVTSQHTHLNDTVCSLCPDGTYSDVDDYISTCKIHTSCDSLGRDLKVAGTLKTDAECGDFKCKRSCNWILPAGLWAGLVVTALIIFLALFIICWRTKRRSKKSITISDFSSTSPTLPPDILKYPAVCDVEKHEESHAFTYTVKHFSNMDSDLGTMPVIRESAANQCSESDSITYHSAYQSEPQETEWHD